VKDPDSKKPDSISGPAAGLRRALITRIHPGAGRGQPATTAAGRPGRSRCDGSGTAPQESGSGTGDKAWSGPQRTLLFPIVGFRSRRSCHRTRWSPAYSRRRRLEPEPPRASGRPWRAAGVDLHQALPYSMYSSSARSTPRRGTRRRAAFASNPSGRRQAPHGQRPASEGVRAAAPPSTHRRTHRSSAEWSRPAGRGRAAPTGPGSNGAICPRRDCGAHIGARVGCCVSCWRWRCRGRCRRRPGRGPAHPAPRTCPRRRRSARPPARSTSPTRRPAGPARAGCP